MVKDEDKNENENEQANPASERLVTFLTTEQFVLQSARSVATSDANGRSSLFISTVSSALVALAFIGQITKVDQFFFIFSLVLFASLFFMGVVTFIRTLQTAIEDSVYAKGLNRIRHFYLEAEPDAKKYFILSGNDDKSGMLQNMGFVSSRYQILFTNASMIGAVNSILAGVFWSLLTGYIFGLATGFGVVIGIVIFGVSFVIHLLVHTRIWESADKKLQVVFPSE